MNNKKVDSIKGRNPKLSKDIEATRNFLFKHSLLFMDKEERNRKIDGIGEEIFGQDIVPDERKPEERTVINDDLIDSVNPNENYAGEAISGAKKTLKEEEERNDTSPEISSDDLDADWSNPEGTGEEHSLGSNPTPDQDRVESVSKPWGEDYPEDEILNIEHKNRRLEDKRLKDEDDTSS